MKVLTFGELLLRLSAPGYEKLFQDNCLKTSFCGAEANVAVSLINFGIESTFVTVLPNSDVGKAAKRSLDYFGVDTSKIVLSDGRIGLYYLEKGASQRPSKIIYDRENSTLALAKPSVFDWNKLFEGVNWFHWSGITPALSDNACEAVLEACQQAKEKGITISCDLNYRKKLWNSNDAQKVMKKLIKYVDVCICNEEDAQLALGIKINSDVENAELSIDDYARAAKAISQDFGCKYIAFTLRESYSANRNGWSAVLYHEDKSYISKKYDIEMVDRVGGGDSFAAGLIYGLLNGMSNQECVDFAAAASCLKQTIEGDFNRISLEEVFSLMNSSGNGRVIR